MYAVVEGKVNDQQHCRIEPAKELESGCLVGMIEGVVGVNRYRNGGRGKVFDHLYVRFLTIGTCFLAATIFYCCQ